jgi:ribose-phosphate pyrophosphokinase
MQEHLKIFSGNANPGLAKRITQYLKLALGQAQIRRFSDGEIFIEIEENVRGVDVFVVQPTCPPVNENLMELLIMIDTLKRASADRITAVIPYYGYARQDRKVAPRTPITSKLVADLITSAGADRILCMDLHAGQIQGFFDVPMDHLYALPVFLDHAKKHLNKPMVISPDAGGVERARAYAKRLDSSLAIIDKRRSNPNETQVMNIIGDVRDQVTVIVDDMIDTAGTLTKAAAAIMENGAKEVHAYSTHGVFSGAALERIENSPLKSVVVSDTIPLSDAARKIDKIKQLTVADLLGEAVRRTHQADSVSSLFI